MFKKFYFSSAFKIFYFSSVFKMLYVQNAKCFKIPYFSKCLIYGRNFLGDLQSVHGC